MGLVLDEEGGRAFAILGEGECLWLLEKAWFGRVGVSVEGLPAIFPVNYAMDGGAIYFLTSEGTKFSAALRGATVAFEIDYADVRYHHGWSVLAIGEAHEVEEAEAKELLQRLPLEPWAPGRRDHLVRIRPDFLSGRQIGSSHPGSA